MRYLIDNVIIFDDAKNSLSNANTTFSTQLAATPTRLLAYLLERASEQKVVDRDTILIEVFDSHGARGTYSNLNQNLALLRKAFTLAGFKRDIVETMPRVGIRINKLVGVQVIDQSRELIVQSSETSKVPDASQVDETSPGAFQRVRKWVNGTQIWNSAFFIILGGLLLLLAANIFYNANRSPLFDIPRAVVSHKINIDKCVVNVLLSEKSATDALIRSRVEDFLFRNNLKCSPEDEYFYYYNQASNNNFNSFLVRCYMSNGSVSECRNSLLEK